MNARLRELANEFPEIPPFTILKVDVLREGLRYTPVLSEIAKWAVPETLYVFEYDHYQHLRDVAKPESPQINEETGEPLEEGWVRSPYAFKLPNGLLVQIGFDSRSPYEIQARNGDYWLFRDGEPLEKVTFQERPSWFSKRTSDGTLMSNVIQLMGRDVMVGCILRHCEYFNDNTSCRFCSLVEGTRGIRGAGIEREMGIKLARLTETYRAALADGVRILILTGGSLIDDRREAAMYTKLFAALDEVRKEAGAPTMFLAGTLAFPREDCERLRAAGVQNVTFDLEVWDRELFEVVVPGKAKYIGRAEWERRLLDAVKVFGPAHVGSNLVIGVELEAPGGFRDPADGVRSNTEGFEWMAAHGIVPMMTVWKPKAGSVYYPRPTPPTEYFLEVGRARRRVLKKSAIWSECIDIWK